MQYIVTMTLSNGNELKAKINGHSEGEAVKNLQFNKKAQDFFNSEENAFATITNTTVEPLQPRYYFRSYFTGDCLCIDTKYGFRLQWQRGHYNETAEADRIERLETLAPFDATTLDSATTAAEMQSMADWISSYHHDDAFDPITPNQHIANMLKEAMDHSGFSELDLSEASGTKLNSIHGILNSMRKLDSGHLYQLVRLMGAELRIVFPDEE